MAEYGPIDSNDDPMKKKSSFGELLDNAKDAAKEKAKDTAEQKEEPAKPRNIFEMLKPKSEQKEDEVVTNPFLEALQDKDEDEEAETDIFGRKVNAENNPEEIEESTEATETEPEADDSSKTPEAETSAEAPEEAVELESEEVAEVAVGYAESTAEDAQNELDDSEPGSLEEAEAAASLAFAEAVKEQAAKDAEINEASIEQAAQSAAAELDIPDIEQEEDEAELNQAQEAEVLETAPIETETPESLEPVSTEDQEAEVITPENAEEDEKEEDAHTPTPPVTTTAPLINQPHGANNINGPNTFGANMATPNVYNPAGLNTIEAKTLARRSAAKGLLVGGVVGYMVGRRRGRIKTEEKLLPVQKKLEKQVSDLHDQLTEQEMKLRRKAAVYFEQNSSRSLKQLEKIQEMREKELDHTRTQEAVSASAAEQNTDASTSEQGERAVEYKSGSNESLQENYERQMSPQSVEAMTIPLLLSLAETIVVGETSLRTMYERGSVNQNQLRRIIKEYLNGEEIQKVLPEVMGQEFINEQAFNKMDDDQTHAVGSQDQTIATTIQPQIDNQAINPNIINNSSPTESFSPAVQSILQQQKKQDSTSPLPMIVGVVIFASIIAAFIFFVL